MVHRDEDTISEQFIHQTWSALISSRGKIQPFLYCNTTSNINITVTIDGPPEISGIFGQGKSDLVLKFTQQRMTSVEQVTEFRHATIILYVYTI